MLAAVVLPIIAVSAVVVVAVAAVEVLSDCRGADADGKWCR